MSVTSLDRDLRDMRLSKYTPQAANEVREWIEEVLHEKLPAGDLIAALKDGVALCKYVVDPQPVSIYILTLGFCQAGEPGGFAKHQVQAVVDAFCADGEHLTFPPRMPESAAESPAARYLPYGRSLRKQGPRASLAVSGVFQQDAKRPPP